MARMMPWKKTLAALPFALLSACTQPEGPDRKTVELDTQPTAALTSEPSKPGLAGCWKLTQGNYRGILSLRQEGEALKGFMDWDNHVDALVEGTVIGQTVDLKFIYIPPKEPLVGRYQATLSADGRSFTGVTGGVVPFTARSQACAELSGCWEIRQDGYVGTLNLVWKAGGLVTGFMDWDNHADASVTGTVYGGIAKMTFTYRDEKKGVVGIYESPVSSDKLTFTGGWTWDAKFPEVKAPWRGYSIPCKDISGCFRVTQTNADGGRFTGLFRIAQSPADTTLSGTAEWDNHEDGILAGDLSTRRVGLTLTYPGTPKEGLVGYYQAVIDPAGDVLGGGTTRSNTGDAGTFTGLRDLCPVP